MSAVIWSVHLVFYWRFIFVVIYSSKSNTHLLSIHLALSEVAIAKAPKLVQSIQIRNTFSFDIWKSIQKKSINKLQLLQSPTQFEEINKIDTFFLNLVKSFGFESRRHNVYKTETGYSVYHCCNVKSRCKSKWTHKIEIESGDCQTFFTKQCEHVNLS